MNLLKQKFLDWVKQVGIDGAAKDLGVYPSNVKRWVEQTHQPSLDVISTFYEKCLSQEATICKVDTNELAAVSQIIALKEKGDISEWAIKEMRDLFFTWEGKKLAMMFPCYKNTNPATAWCLMATALDIGKEKLTGFMDLGDAVIQNTRNRLAKKMVENDVEWGLFLDDDMVPPIGRAEWWKWIVNAPKDYPDSLAGTHFARRLMSHKKKLVGGMYFGRNPNGQPMFHKGLTNYETHVASRDYLRGNLGLEATDWVATGCMLIHRDVFLDIQEKFPELGPEENGGDWNYFRLEKGRGEDVAFCERALAAGHQPHCDMGCIVAHIGWAAYGPWNTKPAVNF